MLDHKITSVKNEWDRAYMDNDPVGEWEEEREESGVLAVQMTHKNYTYEIYTDKQHVNIE